MPASRSSAPAIDLDHYVRVAKGASTWVIGFVAVGLIAAVAYLLVVASTYTATASINVNVISADPFANARSASGLLDPATEAAIASSYAVAQRAADELGGTATAADIRRTVTAQPVADATILKISSSADDRRTAQRQTDVVAEQYLMYRAAQAADRRSAILDGLESALAELETERSDAEGSERAAIQQEVDSLRVRRNTLVGIDTSGGSVLNPAIANDVLMAPSRRFVLASGALAGGVLGIMLAFLSNVMARRVRSMDDLGGAFDTDNVTLFPAGIATAEIGSQEMDHLRLLRDRAVNGLAVDVPRVCVLDHTSAEHTGDVPAKVAAVFAQRMSAPRIILAGLSAESRREVVRYLNLLKTKETGMRSPHVPDAQFHLVEASTDTREPDSAVTNEVIELASGPEEYSTILIVPATSGEASRVAAAARSDLVVVVAETGVTTRRSLQELDAELASIDRRVDGVVLVAGHRRPEDEQTQPQDGPDLASKHSLANGASAVEAQPSRSRR